MLSAASQIPESVKIQQQLTSIHVDQWLKDDVFTVRWWILLFLMLISLVVWWLLLDKSKLKDVILYTALAVILTLGIHEYGEELTLWDYPTDIIPIFPPLSSVNLLLLPLMYSLVYQYCKPMKRFVVAVLLMTSIFCFIVEPVLAWGGFIHLIRWKTIFSYPIYVLMAICVRYLTMKIVGFTEKSKGRLL